VLIALPVSSRLDPIVGDLSVLGLSPEAEDAREKIVIVTITEETLAGFPYRSPIDRGFLADLIKALDAANPAGIGLDILLDSPSEPAKDRRLLAAIDGASAPVVLASVPGRFLTEQQAAHLKTALDGRIPGDVTLQRDDADGILRHLPRSGRDRPLLTETLAGRHFPDTPFDSRILYQVAPSGGQGPFPKYPAHTVPHLPKDWFAGKYVLIGTDLPEVDRHPTPLVSASGAAAGHMAGLEVHAHVLAQLLSGRHLPVLTFAQSFSLLLVFAVLSAIGFFFTGRVKVFFVGLGAVLVLYSFAWIGVRQEILLLPVLGPVTASATCVFLLALIRWRQDRRERAFVVSAFEKYVSPEIVRRLASGEVDLAIGGEKRLVTYVFTDIEGFTTLSEQLPADQVADILNGYLHEVCDVVIDNGATLDKLIGDAVVCLYGAPEADPAQAEKAVALAMELDRTAERYRAALAKRGTALGVTRIGIHCGEAVIGNFGGHRFFDYTGIGDTVNTAARLEGANKYLGSRICVSGAVVERCRGNPALAFRPLGDLAVKGRSQALACFEPLAPDAAQEPWAAAYQSAFGKLEDDPAAARDLFEKVLQDRPGDGPARFHLDRLEKGQTGAKVTLFGK
jgi:adenylate cyclase